MPLLLWGRPSSQAEGVTAVVYDRGADILFSITVSDETITFSDVLLQSFLSNRFALCAPIASPTFRGTPRANILDATELRVAGTNISQIYQSQSSMSSYVTMDGEQTITGSKFFTAATRLLNIVRVRPSAAGTETSITFFHDPDELARVAGDIWRVGVAIPIQQGTARNFIIEAWGGP